MSETNDEVKKEQAIDEAIDKVPEANEVFKDKPENEEGKTTAEATTEDEKPLPETEEQREEAIESKTVEEEVKEEAEPLYQKKVYIIDLINIGIKPVGMFPTIDPRCSELVVDVMSVKDGKAIIKNGELTMKVPKEFLF